MLKSFLKSQSIRFAALLVIVIASVATTLAPPQILRLIVDNHLTTGQYDGLMFLGILYATAYIFGGGLDFAKGRILAVLGQKAVHLIRGEMVKKLYRMPLSDLSAEGGGSQTSRIMNDVDNVAQLFTDGVVSMAMDTLKIIGIIISLWMFSVWLGLFSLVLIPGMVVLTRWFRKRMRRSQEDNLDQLARVSEHLKESVQSFPMIKSLGAEPYMKWKYGKCLEENYATMNKVNFYDSCYSPLVQVIAALSISFILWGAAGGASGIFGISVGKVAATVALVTALFDPIDKLGMEIQNIQKGLSGADRIKSFLNRDEENRATVKFLPEDITGGDICVHNMTFAYPGCQPIFSDANMRIKQGEHVVLTGRTGSGKTTLIKLLTGVLFPTQGSITIDGKNPGAVQPSRRRELFGYITQELLMVYGNVFDEVSLFDPQIEPKDVEAALKIVGLWDYVCELPCGLETAVHEETFSQGQRRLLSIARGIVSSPDVLILDEITSGLDSETAARVFDAIERVAKGKTVITIAHGEEIIARGGRRIDLDKK